MNLTELLKRATPAAVPLSAGTWATLLIRPDLGSQQEFIVGAIASIEGDDAAHVRLIPSFAKLSRLYGDSTNSLDLQALLDGCERAIYSTFKGNLRKIDCGSPHIRLNFCGYFSADNIDAELTQLLKRHASVIWAESQDRDERLDDDWAYSQMLSAFERLQAPKNIIVPHRSLNLGSTELTIAFDNGRSFGSVVSARYSNFSTVERHIFRANLEVTTAHRLAHRTDTPALFVVLPPATSHDDVIIRERSSDFLAKLEASGIQQFASDDTFMLAQTLAEWAQEHA